MSVVEEVDLGQLSVDESPGVHDGAGEGVTPQDGVVLRLTDDSLRHDGLDLPKNNASHRLT